MENRNPEILSVLSYQKLPCVYMSNKTFPPELNDINLRNGVSIQLEAEVYKNTEQTEIQQEGAHSLYLPRGLLSVAL